MGLRQRYGEAHSHGNIGTRKHWAVVQPVTHHQHLVALLLQTLQVCQLGLGRAITLCVTDVQWLGNAAGSLRPVAGQHLHRHTHCVQGSHGFCRIRANRFIKLKTGKPAYAIGKVNLHCRIELTVHLVFDIAESCRPKAQQTKAVKCCRTIQLTFKTQPRERSDVDH